MSAAALWWAISNRTPDSPGSRPISQAISRKSLWFSGLAIPLDEGVFPRQEWALCGNSLPLRRHSAGDYSPRITQEVEVALQINSLAQWNGMVLPVLFSPVKALKEIPFMVFAIAALLFQLAPAPQALPDVALASTTPVVSTVSVPAASASTQPASGRTNSTDRSLNGTSSGTLTAASLETATQNSQSLSTIRVPEIQPAKPVRFIATESVPSRRSWIALSIAQHSAAAFDAYSTRQAIAAGAVEDDPMMRPFAHSPGIYAAIQVGPAILDFVGRRMQRSQNSFLRRTWWVPQSAATGIFLFSGVHNMSVANHP